MNLDIGDRGEAGQKRGLLTEESILKCLSKLGFAIFHQNFNIPCYNPDTHKKTSHGIDGLVNFRDKNLQKPIRSPEGLSMVSCKAGYVKDADIIELKNSIECLRTWMQYQKYNEKLSGGIIITNEQIGAWDLLNKDVKDVYGWDLRYLIFNAVRASNYNVFSKIRWPNVFFIDFSFPREFKLNEDTICIITRSLPWGNQILVFYEGTKRFSLDMWEDLVVNKCSQKTFNNPFSIHVEIHSLNGFTSDILAKEKKTYRNFLRRIMFNPKLLIDYTNPWEVILTFSLVWQQ